MKKFSLKTVPTASIILTIIFIMLLIWGFFMNNVSKNAEAYNDVVTVQNGITTQDNEGKYICATGKLTSDSVLTDNLTGVAVEGIMLRRNVDMYQYSTDGDVVVKKFLSYQEKNIKGRGGEKYENPTFPKDLQSETVYADVSVDGGNFTLSPHYLYSLTSSYPLMDKQISPVKVPIKTEIKNTDNFKLQSDGSLSNGDTSNPKIGDIRITYEYLPADAVPSITLIGKQTGSTVGENDEFAIMSDKCSNAQELVKLLVDDSQQTAKSMFIMAFVMLAIAVLVYIIKAKKRRSQDV